jgi:hypothetical protein
VKRFAFSKDSKKKLSDELLVTNSTLQDCLHQYYVEVHVAVFNCRNCVKNNSFSTGFSFQFSQLFLIVKFFECFELNLFVEYSYDCF